MNYILTSEVSNLRMAAGNEKKYTRIIHEGQLKEWVGIGWTRLRKATERDKSLWPTAVDKLP